MQMKPLHLSQRGGYVGQLAQSPFNVGRAKRKKCDAMHHSTSHCAFKTTGCFLDAQCVVLHEFLPRRDQVLGLVDEDVADATALTPRAATATPALVLGAVTIPLRTFQPVA
jgi:hypothetical protein